MEEIWKDIPGYEGLYQASTCGNIKSLERTVKIGDNERIVKERLLVLQLDSHGYYRIRLSNKCKTKKFMVHRLIAMTFIPNPNNYRCINHKDEVRTNNFVFVNEDGSVDYEKSNLEWCTHKYNSNYGTIKERLREKHLNHPAKSKCVEQLDKDGNHIAFFPSVHEAERALNIKGNDVHQTCVGRRKTAKGFIWRYI